MRFYLHAFCLDDGKAQPGNEDMWVGPFDWFQLTWDWLRAGRIDDDASEDHQFGRDESGFWYPMAYVKTSENGGSMQPDYERGRFSDIEHVAEASYGGFASLPVAVRVVESEWDKAALIAAAERERIWMETPYDG